MGTIKEPLRKEWQLFVDEYLIDLNASKAAKRAGFGTTQQSAGELGYRLLKKVEIRRAIRKAFRKRLERIRMTSDQVLKELAIIGLSDVQDYEVNDVTGRLISLGNRKASKAVQSVKIKKYSRTNDKGETETEVTTEYKLWDKLKAIELMMRHMGMLDNGETGQPITDTERRRRVNEAAASILDYRRIAVN